MEEMDVGDAASSGDETELKNTSRRDLKDDTKVDDLDDESRMIEDEEKLSEDDDKKSEDSDKDDDEDLDDDDEEKADEAEVKILEATLAQNPYDYACHVSLINKFQKMGELERLRAARENMSVKYPLSPELWKSWIQDEIKLATTEEEKKAVVLICERAVQDYLSVELWLEYLQFSIGTMGSEKDAAKNVRQLFERALTAASGHITKGAIIWEAFREFENVLVSMAVDSSNSVERKEQMDRVEKLFTRQLKVPLLDMEKTLEEYEAWRNGEGAEVTSDYENVIANYEAAYKKLSDRLPFEEKIVSAPNESEMLDSYKAYLMYEKKYVGDPGRITVLYERALAELSVEASLWLDYVTYLESELRIENILDPVFKRAARNVPWCSQIWQKRIRTYEKWKKPVLEIQHVFEEALEAGFPTAEEYRNLWVLYLEFLRRRVDLVDDEDERDKQLETLRNTFNRACEYLAKAFGLEGDPDCVILQFWARTEAIHAKDMEKARELWTDILSQGHNAKASSWLEFIGLERCYGTTKHLRKLYPKALLLVKDWPESIANAWIDFERDEGTLEQLEICEAKTKERLEKVNDERQKSKVFANPLDIFGQSKISGKRKTEETGKMRKSLGISPKKISRSIESQKPKPKLRESILKLDKKEKNSNEKMDESSSIEPPPGYKEDEKMEEDSSPEVDDKISIFISNLDYTATEEEVKQALEPAGPITLFKMVRDIKGRSKGFCYVQLSSAEAVEEALKLDRTKINGRPMYISRCNPNKSTRGHAFKFKCGLEKNKLYVKGLTPSITSEELNEIFKPYGAIADIRIPVYRNGHAKGMAYIDFQDEASASKALIATDGMLIKDKPISVMISNPKERKKDASEDDHRIKSLGGHAATKSFSQPRSALSMVPRTIILNSTSNGNVSKLSEEIKPKTNKEFKEMFLKK